MGHPIAAARPPVSGVLPRPPHEPALTSHKKYYVNLHTMASSPLIWNLGSDKYQTVGKVQELVSAEVAALCSGRSDLAHPYSGHPGAVAILQTSEPTPLRFPPSNRCATDAARRADSGTWSAQRP